MKIMKVAVKILILMASLLLAASCNKTSVGSGLIYGTGQWGDLSQVDEFDPSMVLGDWVSTKRTKVTYIDGELTESKDESWRNEQYSFYGDETVSVQGVKGQWTYSRNFLIWTYSGGMASAEVMYVSDTKMVWRQEIVPDGLGSTYTSFYLDKSGKHRFDFYEFEKK